MDFKTVLDTLPPIDHLSGLAILDNGTVIHHIPAVAGKLGSLRVYNALAQEFNGNYTALQHKKAYNFSPNIRKMRAKMSENTRILICCCA